MQTLLDYLKMIIEYNDIIEIYLYGSYAGPVMFFFIPCQKPFLLLSCFWTAFDPFSSDIDRTEYALIWFTKFDYIFINFINIL